MPGQRPGIFGGSPDRIRTGVTALRGRRPRPLDDGAVHPRQDSTVPRSRDSGMASGVQTTASQPLWRTGGHAGGPSAATRLTAASTSSPFPLAGRPLARIVVSSKPTPMSRPRRTAARSTGQVAEHFGQLVRAGLRQVDRGEIRRGVPGPTRYPRHPAARVTADGPQPGHHANRRSGHRRPDRSDRSDRLGRELAGSLRHGGVL
jgi:hypothetical protein